MLESLPPEQRTAIYAGAFLLYARVQANWSPPPLAEPSCRCDQCAPPPPRKPLPGTSAWFADMHRRHGLHQRGQR
jgi:hypothetical protein